MPPFGRPLSKTQFLQKQTEVGHPNFIWRQDPLILLAIDFMYC